jgi:fucose 4-O-acetylase-like acetyltransferase
VHAGARLGFLDFVRGWAILAVVLMHVLQLMDPTHPAYWLSRVLDHTLRPAVPLFMGILGAMAMTRYPPARGWGRLFREKGWTLCLPYVCWSLIYAYDPEVYGVPVPDLPVWLAVPLGTTEGHLYFMVAYLLTLLLLPPALALLRALSGRGKVAALGAAALVHLALLVQAEHQVTNGVVDGWYVLSGGRLPIHWLIFVCAGAGLAMVPRWGADWAARARAWWPLMLPLGVLHVFLASTYADAGAVDPFQVSPVFVPVSATALGLLALCWPWVRRSRVDAPLRWLGQRSLPIYLSHVLFLKLAWIVWPGEASAPVPLILCGVAATLAAVAYAWVHPRVFSAPQR